MFYEDSIETGGPDVPVAPDLAQPADHAGTRHERLPCVTCDLLLKDISITIPVRGKYQDLTIRRPR